MFKKGFSLIEILVVIGIFSVIAVIATQSIAVSLISSRKTDATVKVRENLEYAVSVLERRIRSAKSIDNITSCPSTPPGITRINYTDVDDASSWFQCSSVGSSGYIETESGQLTSDEITITQCSFTCYPESPGVPARIMMTITAQPKEGVTTQNYPVSISTTVSLRVY